MKNIFNFSIEDYKEVSKLIKSKAAKCKGYEFAVGVEYKNYRFVATWWSIAVGTNDECLFRYDFKRAYTWRMYEHLKIIDILIDIACCPADYTVKHTA